MRKAVLANDPQLVELMRVFCAEANFVLDDAHAAQAFATLLADERRGAVWLLEAEASSQVAGYLVLTWCYSIEYDGMKAVLDDFFGCPTSATRVLAKPHEPLCPTFAEPVVCGPSR